MFASIIKFAPIKYNIKLAPNKHSIKHIPMIFFILPPKYIYLNIIRQV
nr:MAG TPA: hypothetical protein [Caudoviricetes sp.]